MDIEKLFREYVREHIDSSFKGSFNSEITLLEKSFVDSDYYNDNVLSKTLDVYMVVYVEKNCDYCYWCTILYSPTKGFKRTERNWVRIKDNYEKFIPDPSLSFHCINCFSHNQYTNIISKSNSTYSPGETIHW